MKHINKIALILVSVGVLAALIALAAVRFDVYRFRIGEPKEEVSYTQDASGIREILMEDVYNSITIIPSPDGDIHLTYYENNLETYTVSNDNGILRFSYDNRNWWLFSWGIGSYLREEKSVTLALPLEFEGTVSARTTNGSIDAKEISLSGGLAMRSTNGALTCKQVTAGGDVIGHTSNGSIIATDVQGGNIELRTTNGSVELTDINALGSVRMSSSNGRLNAQNLTVATRLEITGTNGSITGTSISAEEIYLSSTNGRIAVQIEGVHEDFRIRSSTVNGSNSLPGEKETGEKALEVRTMNGDIDVQFTGQN